MDLIAERGIAAHYSGKIFANGLVRHVMPYDRISRGKTISLNNANVALRVLYMLPLQNYDHLSILLQEIRDLITHHR